MRAEVEVMIAHRHHHHHHHGQAPEPHPPPELPWRLVYSPPTEGDPRIVPKWPLDLFPSATLARPLSPSVQCLHLPPQVLHQEERPAPCQASFLTRFFSQGSSHWSSWRLPRHGFCKMWGYV